MLTTIMCSICQGRPMERLEERRADGTWHHNRSLDPALADKWIATDPTAPLRWADAPCPRCDGRGSYEIESIRGARIF